MPSAMTENPTPVGYLRGHKAPVICLASCSHSSSTPEIEQLLASGSEDGTGRIWDVRTGRVVKGFKGFDDAVTSVCFPPKQSYQFFLSSGQKVYAYDLRKPDLVLKKAETEFEFSSEEINQIAIDEKNKYLATADDSGEVRVIDLKSRKVCKKFRSRHENICMCVQFRPRRPWEVWSGGMDSKLIMWDFSRGSPSETFDMNGMLPSPTPAPESQPPPLINPPFAHCMSISDNGRFVAAGLGDGSIRLLSAPVSSDRKSSTQWTQERLLEGHGYAVTAVEFAKFTPNKLLSAGSDGTLVVWDVSTAPASVAPLDTNVTAPQDTSRLLKCFNALPVFDKINCLTTSRDESGGNMFVAGTGLRKDTEGVIAIFAIQ